MDHFRCWKFYFLFVLIVLLASPKHAHSLRSGTEGGTSDGDMTVELTVPPLMKVSGITDLAGTFTGQSEVVLAKDLCVYNNTSDGTYTVVVEGDGAGTPKAFTVRTTTDSISYTVKWNDAAGTSGGVAVTSGQELTGQGNMSFHQDCSDKTNSVNANFELKFLSADMSKVPAGQYKGKVTITIKP